MAAKETKRFENLTYEDFRRMATDESLSGYEKVGFPDEYREGKEEAIFADIVAKLPALSAIEGVVVDIGPGCSELPRMLIDLCQQRRHTLVLVDSDEMLAQLPEGDAVRVAGRFPDDAPLDAYVGKADAVLVYSVLHHVFAEANLWAFIDRSLELLRSGGRLLLGDIPNVSKRKRFFSSAAGVAHHQQFTGTASIPAVTFNMLEPRKVDDAVVLGIVTRARLAGFDAYVVPQPETLPMANRREDVLIEKP